MFPSRVIIQSPYLTRIKTGADLITDPLVRKQGKEYVVERDPTPAELDDLLTAWYVNIGTRSNGVVIVKNGVTLAVGSGQQERVGAVEQAIVKAYQKALDRYNDLLPEDEPKVPFDIFDVAKTVEFLKPNPLRGAVLSSDGFFPFPDSLDLCAEVGISAVCQPGGSRNDHLVIDAANKYGIAMPFTLERCFGHF